MKPKKIAVMYDCGTDKMRGLETRISIRYDALENGEENKFLSAFAINQDGTTASVVNLELTNEVVKEILEILSE